MVDRAQEIGVFRWRIVGEAADVSLSARERGALVRALAAREHLGPDGRWVRVSRNTVDRWVRAYREGGFEALVRAPRRMPNQTPGACWSWRARFATSSRPGQRRRSTGSSWRGRASHPLRRVRSSVTSWRRGCRGTAGRSGVRWGGSRRSPQRVVDRGRASRPAGRRPTHVLFCFLDDHSRLVRLSVGGREDVLDTSRALRAGLASRGLPRAVYVDNGLTVRLRPTVAGLRDAGDPADPLPAGAAGGMRED